MKAIKLWVLIVGNVVLLTGCSLFAALFAGSVELNVLIEGEIKTSDGYDRTGYYYDLYSFVPEADVEYRVDLVSVGGAQLYFQIKNDNHKFIDMGTDGYESDTHTFNESEKLKVSVSVKEGRLSKELSDLPRVTYAFIIRSGLVPLASYEDAGAAVKEVNSVINGFMATIADGSYSSDVRTGESGTATLDGSKTTTGVDPDTTETWDFSITFENYLRSDGVQIDGVCTFDRTDHSYQDYDPDLKVTYQATDVSVALTGSDVDFIIDKENLRLSDTMSFDVTSVNNNQFSLTGTATTSAEVFSL